VREVGTPVRKATARVDAPAEWAGWVWRQSLASQLRAADHRRRRQHRRRQAARTRFQRGWAPVPL